ncbi:hypothetical protein BUALT_Bualt14G0055200 [Buddleja alternifolia]|uniref:Uncharacterized protein n=1 Tax=Buddleja alternifolia TaxID=168488 RepID=A0AAV6WN30_9LAMI|nr:hypothetical protein BUALT_Bualt14G0055200 [Buddleja alternifolia]
METGAVVCATLCGLPFLIWLIVEIVLISQAHMPIFTIQDFYVPALNTKLPEFNSTTTVATFIFFDLELKNVMSEVGVRYENVDLVFYYGTSTTPETSLFSIANYTIPGFYQGDDKAAHRREVVETRGVPWLDAFGAVSNGSTVVFSVELAAKVKLKRFFWYDNEREVMLGGNVEVDGNGEKVYKKGIKLKSTASKGMKDILATNEFNLGVVDFNSNVSSS